METPKVYRELGVWIAEWPDGTFIAATDLTDLDKHIDSFMAAGCTSSRRHAYSYTVAVACLIGALVILGLCAVASVL